MRLRGLIFLEIQILEIPIDQPKFKVSLPFFLVLPFLLQIFAIVGLIGWLSFRNGKVAVDELTTKLRTDISDQAKDKIKGYTAVPALINQITANAIKTNSSDSLVIQRQIWRQLLTFPDTNFHYFGKADGEFYAARRLASGKIQVGIANQSTDRQINYFSPDQNGNLISLTEVFPDKFDPRLQPWFKTAVAAGKPKWTQIYQNPTTKNLTISATYPLYGNSAGNSGNNSKDQKQNLTGVIASDFALSEVTRFLQSLKIGTTGQVFIMEKSGALVGTSGNDQIFAVRGDTTDRILAQDSENAVVRLAAQQFFKHQFDKEQNLELEFQINGNKHFARISSVTDSLGLDWLVVVAIPESEFLGKIQQNTQITVLACAIALIISSIVISLYFAHKITKPILNLSSAVANLTNQQDTITIPEEGMEELKVLAKSFNTMSSQLEATFIDLHHSAYHDPLTGLPNRTAFLHSLENRISRRQVEPEYLFALLFLDLDRFKLVNDSLGHLMGDLLLVAVTKRLQSCLRKTDMLSRFGGDEFIILLNEIPSIEFANQFSERLQKTLNQPFDLEGHQIFTSASIGIVSPLNSTGSPQDLLRDADIALYQAKQEGKARSKVFDAAMHDQANTLLQLEMDLRRAISLPINIDEFAVYYQPIIAIKDLSIVGCEALIRWNHPTRGLLNPGMFLSVAEDMGAIASIDWWVMRQACTQMQSWLEEFPSITLRRMSVNLSSSLFLQTGWMEHIDQILTETNLAHKHLKLELVESTLMDSTDATRAALEKLRSSGIKLDIDDFGTGYSSLSYLCRFPLDAIKIDRSFITNLEKENLEIVKAVIILAQNLGMQTVAEGVETFGQLEILRKLGCDRAQGYFFSPPISAEEIIKFFV